MFMQKILDFVYITFFGKYTLDGFVIDKTELPKYNYVFDSVFPNDEIMKIALSPPSSTMLSIKKV